VQRARTTPIAPNNPFNNAGPVAPKLPADAVLVSCSKGILNGTLETVDQLLHRVLPAEVHGRLAFMSGPSFAKEVRSTGRGLGWGVRRSDEGGEPVGWRE
jgi:hypothetical protein